MAVRPQPRHISSNSVEQMATQGESVAIKAFLDGSESCDSTVSSLGVEGVLRITRSLAFEVRPFFAKP